MWGVHRWPDGMGAEFKYCGFWFTIRAKHNRDRGEKTIEGGTSRCVVEPPPDSSLPHSALLIPGENELECVCLPGSHSFLGHTEQTCQRQVIQSSRLAQWEPSTLDTSICAMPQTSPPEILPGWLSGLISPSPTREVVLGAGASLVCGFKGHTDY